MAINSKDFIPRPGFVNKQGYLPDPVELCCIQVPKVFDQCLKKECLKPVDDCEQLCKEIPGVTDPAQIRCVGCCKNLKVVVNSVTKCPVTRQPDYKKVSVNYTVTFDVDVKVKLNGIVETKTVSFSVTRSINACKLYCPDAIVKTIIGRECTSSEEIEQEFIKLEIVGDCLSTDISQIKCGDHGCGCSCPDPNPDNKVFLCVTLGLFIIIKCEILVQLLVPAYGYCPVPRERCECEEDACKEFMRRPIPDLYPPQKMDNLFDEDVEKDRCLLRDDDDEMDRDDYR